MIALYTLVRDNLNNVVYLVVDEQSRTVIDW